MIDRVVALGGPPGSGKTTAARQLAAGLGLSLVNAGERFRAEAVRRGMDLLAFSAFAEAHPEIDRELDGAMAREAAAGRLLEGRIQGPLLRRDGIPVHWLSVVARLEVRAGRIARRDSITLEAAREHIRTREGSERSRYRTLYAIDLDREEPDLTVDSSDRSPEEVVALLAEFLTARGAVHVR